LKIASVAEVKAQFSASLKESEQGLVIVTRNDKAVAALLAVRDDDELERLVLAHSPRLQALLETARQQKFQRTLRFQREPVCRYNGPLCGYNGTSFRYSRRVTTLFLPLAAVLDVDVSARLTVVEQVPAGMIRVVIDHEVLAAIPAPVTLRRQRKRSQNNRE
jgi:hypothetical protein